MREAFPPCLPITNNSSGIENNNNNHKEYNNNQHSSQTSTLASNNCLKGKDLNIDRNNEITRDVSIHDTEKICFDSDEGKVDLD